MACFMPIRTRRFLEKREYNNEIYRKLFRFNKENVEWLAQSFLGNNNETRGAALTNLTKMEILLRSLGDPGFQIGVGIDLGVHQTTVSKIIHEVAEKIASKKHVWISFPTNLQDIEAAREGWHVPGAIGAIDCTHIRIVKPSLHGPEYYNRKGYCSINVQATCNYKEIFTSIDASWPGSVHDSRVWKNSLLCEYFVENYGQEFLLGDEGYGIAPWLMVPYKNPTTALQRNYNKVHSRHRVKIECCFGQLKRRFPMLNYTLRWKTSNLCKYITAGFILHNAAKYLNDPFDFDELNDEQPFCVPPREQIANIRQVGQQKRDLIAQNLFNAQM